MYENELINYTHRIKKKILYISKEDFPWDIRTDKICSSLSERYEVSILCRHQHNSLESEYYNDIYIKRIGFSFKSIFWTFPLSINPIWKYEIEKYIKECKPNLIIVREMHLAYAAGKLAQKYNIPIIMDMAENYPAAIKLWKKYNNSALKRYLFHKLKLADNIEVNSLKYMNGVITVCDEQHSRVQSLTKNILSFKTIYNTPEKNTFSKKTNIISDKITFGHHGHLTAEKKINVLLKSFILLCDLYYNSKSHNQANNIDFQLLIAGDGDCFQDLTNIANKSEFKDRITFTGNYEYAKLNKILDKIDVGVIPYEFNNFNNFTIHNKIFDFFAKGIPVIVSKAIPNANVVYSTNSGIVCDCEIVEELTHSMFEIIGNKYNYYAENSYFAFNNKYNWDIDSNNLIDFINDCIN